MAVEGLGIISDYLDGTGASILQQNIFLLRKLKTKKLINK